MNATTNEVSAKAAIWALIKANVKSIKGELAVKGSNMMTEIECSLITKLSDRLTEEELEAVAVSTKPAVTKTVKAEKTQKALDIMARFNKGYNSVA